MKGLGAHALRFVITALVPIVSVPLFLHFWGTRLYGDWLLLSTIPAYFAMSDVGFSTVAANEMTMRVARDDIVGALKVFQSIWTFVTSISVAAAVLGTAAAWALPFEQWLNLSTLGHTEAATTASILLLHVLVGLQGGFNAAGFRCVGLYAQSVQWGTLLRLTEMTGLLAAVAFGAGPVLAAGTFLLLRVIGTGLIRMILARRVHWLVYGWRYARRNIIRDLSGAAVAFMGFPLGNAISIQGLLVLVGILLNPAAVVVLSVVRTLTNVVRQLIFMLQATVWPEMSIALGSGNLALARRLHGSAVQASFGLAVLAASVLLFAGEWIISVWTHGAVNPDPWFFRLMVLVAVVNTVWWVSTVVPTSVNRHRRLAFFYFLSAATSLLMVAVLVPFLGMPGIPLGLLVIDLVMLIYVLPNSLRILGEGKADFVVRLFQHPLRNRVSPADG